MIFKHKIIDIEQTSDKNKEMYAVVRYNLQKKALTFGGRIASMDFIKETIQRLFEIDDEYIGEPAFNQQMNVRFEVDNLDYPHYQKCMEMLKGNYFFKTESLSQLKRLM